MTEAHLDEVMVHEDAMFGTESWSRTAYRAELREHRTRRYLAAVDDDGTVLGWAGAMIIGETAQIMTVGTVPAARRRGIGRSLTLALIDLAAEHECIEVILEVRVDNAGARTLYAGLGFEQLRVRRGYYDGGRVDALELRLAPPPAS